MRPGQYLTRSLVYVDNRGVDGAVVGTAAAVGRLSARLRRWQTGFVRSYALSMLVGAAIVVVAMLAGEAAVNFPWLTTLSRFRCCGAAC